MKSRIFKILSFIIFPFQDSRWIRFFATYSSFGEDAEWLYFSLYGERCSVYHLTNHCFLNKPLFDEFKKNYPKFEILYCIRHTSHQSDITVIDHQRMPFLIMLKPKLFVEYNSISKYRIYYNEKDEVNLNDVLGIFRKYQKAGWLRYYRDINLN